MKQDLQPRAPRQHQLTRSIDSPHLTAHEAVEYLRLGSLSALYRLVREHRLPFGRAGKHYRFHKQHLDRWLEVVGVSTLRDLRAS